MSNLSNQAVRLKRTRWTEAQMLAEEIFLILLQDVAAPELGPVTIDLGDGSQPITIRPDNIRDPSGNFRLPDLDLPALTRGPPGVPGRDGLDLMLNPLELDFDEDQEDPFVGPDGQVVPTRLVRTRIEKEWRRSVMPGKVVSGSGATYTMTLYPAGIDEEGFDAQVTQLDIDPNEKIPAGSWGFVLRMLQVEITTNSVIETIPGTIGERELTRTIGVRILQRKHYVQFPVWM